MKIKKQVVVILLYSEDEKKTLFRVDANKMNGIAVLAPFSVAGTASFTKEVMHRITMAATSTSNGGLTDVPCHCACSANSSGLKC